MPEPYRYWDRVSLVGGVPTRFQPGAATATWVIEQFHRSGDRWVVIDSVSAVTSMETYHLQLTEYRRLFQIAQLTSDPPAPSRSLHMRTINGPLITHVHAEKEPPAECLAVRADADGWLVQASTSRLGGGDLLIYNLRGGVVAHATRNDDGKYYVSRSGMRHQPLWAVVGGCAVRLQ